MVYDHLKKMRKIVHKAQVKPLVFFGLVLIPTIFLCSDDLLGSKSVFFFVLLVMLLTSVIEVPLSTMRTKKPEYSDKEALCIGEIYGVPILEEMRADNERRYKTRITLNVGGFIIPLGFAFYLLLFAHRVDGSPLPLLEVAMSTLLLTLISYMLAEVRAGVGILIPNYVGIFAIPLGFLLAPPGLPRTDVVELLVFVPAIFGILLGILITLVTLPREEVGSAFFNLGGIGSFYSIYLISFLALVLRSLA